MHSFWGSHFLEVSTSAKSSMTSPTTQKSKVSNAERNSCGGRGYQNAAIIVAFLTMANGAVTLVSGVEGLLYGSTLAYDQHVVQTISGTIIVFLALTLLAMLFSRLKVRYSTYNGG